MAQFVSEYFNLSAELICITDLNGKFVDLNPSWMKALGLPKEDLVNQSFVKFLHPDDVQFSVDEFKKLISIKDYKSSGFENRYKHKDGGYRWLQWSASLVENEKKVFCIVRDITEIKRQSLLFAETEEVSRVGSWEIDLSTNELFWSKVTHQIHETDPEKYNPLLADGMKFYTPEAQELLKIKIDGLVKDGHSFDLELPFITEKGKKIWVRSVARAHIRDGVVIRVYGTLEDVSLKKREKSRYELIIENGNYGTWDWDLETNNVYFNDRFCSMIGLDVKTVKHELATWDALTHPEDKKIAYKDIEDHLNGKTPQYRNIHRMKHADGHWVWILDQGKVVEYRDGKPVRFSGTHTDITYLKELESAKDYLDNRFKLILAANKFGVWDSDLNQQDIFWDDNMYDLYGVSAKDHPNAYDVFIRSLHPDDFIKIKNIYSEAILNGTKIDHSFRIKLPNNQIRHIAMKGNIERGNDNIPQRASWVWY